MKHRVFCIVFSTFSIFTWAQNIGIGTALPAAALHVKGNVDTTQLVIDAHSTQTNTRPLLKMRKSDGTDLLWLSSDGPNNVFLGRNAGKLNIPISGVYNTFIGSETGMSNTSGFYNTALGAGSLYANTTGNYNTAAGLAVLANNTTGQSNSALGTNAMFFNTTGQDNTAMGYVALRSNSTGSFNTAIGSLALNQNIVGAYNTATGHGALRNNTGNYNSAFGRSALQSNTGGNSNVAMGAQAMINNTSGNANTAMGYESMLSNTSGLANIGIGYQSMRNNTTGSNNVAAGLLALGSTTSSQYNLALGYAAGDSYDNGWNNVFVGANSDVNGPGYFNVVVVGQGAIATNSNQVRLGNASTTSFFCQGIYASTTASGANVFVNAAGQVFRSTSSERYKYNIRPIDINTSLLYKLRAVSYESKTDGQSHFGLVAEEVAEIIPGLAEYAREKDVVQGSTSEKLVPDAVQYSMLSVLLLKELQEQKIRMDKLTEQVEALQKIIKNKP